MTRDVYRFVLKETVPLDQAEMSLQLAILAAEGLYGGARVRMDVGYHLDEPRRTVVVDANTEVGSAVVRIFTAFLTREFGEHAFEVRRVEAPRASAQEGATCPAR